MNIAILNQEVIRRMINTSEDLDISTRMEIVDDYARRSSTLVNNYNKLGI